MALHFDRNQEATVWIGGLDENVNEALLWELMIQAGPVVSVNIPRDKITREHSGYAFCEFASEEDADYAMKIMNMVRLYGKSLKINKASRDRKDTGVGANVFVGNLDPEVDDQVFRVISSFPNPHSITSFCPESLRTVHRKLHHLVRGFPLFPYLNSSHLLLLSLSHCLACCCLSPYSYCIIRSVHLAKCCLQK